jgi:hypothetical protein
MQAQFLQHLAESIDRRALLEPPTELQLFAKEETSHEKAGHERRRHRRYSLITNVIAIPLDEKLGSAGRPFIALSSGMSVDGIRLIHTEPSPSDRLLIEIEHQPVRFVLSVLRTGSVGDCFEIAGRINNLNSATTLGALSLAGGEHEPIVRPTRFAEDYPPTIDELVHWAGVAAAVQLLSHASPRQLRHVLRV